MSGGEEIQLQVAFAGHRRSSDVGDPAALEAKLVAAIAILKAAGVRRARLLVGLAAGADTMAARLWRREKMGPVHAVLPFLHEGHDQVGPKGAARSGAWLDGAAVQKRGGSPHLAQARWILGHADLLIAVWGGRPRKGSGGTADAVRLALEAGVPILWINPAKDLPTFVPPLPMHHPAGVLETLEDLAGGHASVGATPDPANLGRVLDLQRRPISAAHRHSRLDPLLQGWLWRTFSLFQSVLGGPSTPSPPVAVPDDMAAQPGFQTITSAYVNADHHAGRLSAVHRSEQILLLAAAVLASVIGATPVFWPTLKLYAVIGELSVGVCAFAIWWAAQRSRQHEEWTQMRRLAEQLRLNRAGWVLGVSTRRAGSPSMRHEHQTLARPILRRAEPPNGAYDASRTASWAAWAMEELVLGQADYHHRQGSRNRRISQRIQIAGDAGFAVLLLGLTASAVLAAAPASARAQAPGWLGAAAIALGVVVPAIAAACMALEAKLQFEEQAERSALLVQRLRGLAAETGARPSLEQAQGAFRAASEWLLAEADQWREASGRRRLSRGG